MAIAPGPGPTRSKIQNPNSKRPVWILDFGFWILDFGFRILDFGFWILDFGFWILDFGFWILDQFSLRSFCGGPKRPRLDFGFWISDFGFWILDFGFWILDFGLGLGSIDTVWILHKISTSHADSGRRIFDPHIDHVCIPASEFPNMPHVLSNSRSTRVIFWLFWLFWLSTCFEAHQVH